MQQTITPQDLKALVKANALQSVDVIGQGSVFTIRINGNLTLIKARSGNQLRDASKSEKTYALPAQIFKFLQGAGIANFQVDLTNWQPDAG